MPSLSELCNLGLSSGETMTADDWEEKMLDQLEKLLSNMGMNMSREQLRGLLKQFRSQFEAMGIDEERIAKGDVNFNFDLSNLKDMFQPGMDFGELFKNMGVDVRVDTEPVEIKTPDSDEESNLTLPADDIYLEGWNMSVTVDFAKKGEIEQDQVELNLIDGGTLVEVHRTTQLAPLARIELPHACEDVVDFTLNNGILDITLRLIPPEEALAALPPGEDGDDSIPQQSDITIDVAKDDDDDDDDGGIPIL